MAPRDIFSKRILSQVGPCSIGVGVTPPLSHMNMSGPEYRLLLFTFAWLAISLLKHLLHLVFDLFLCQLVNSHCFLVYVKANQNIGVLWPRHFFVLLVVLRCGVLEKGIESPLLLSIEQLICILPETLLEVQEYFLNRNHVELIEGLLLPFRKWRIEFYFLVLENADTRRNYHHISLVN